MTIYSGDTFEHKGRTFRIEIEADDFGRVPWEESDGEGIVSEWTRREKRPSERILHSDRGSYRYYDMQATTAKAIAEGWDAAPYTGTVRERAARAVEVNFQRLRAWCNDEWSYVGVIVTPICPHCGEAASSQSESLWGIESDCTDYIEETARELAEQIAPAAEHADCEEG